MTSFLDEFDRAHRKRDAPIEFKAPTGGAATDTPYGLAALAGECDNLAGVGEGGRNHALNTSALKLGHIAAAGELQVQTIVDNLTSVALMIGLEPVEIARTLRSGLTAGLAAAKDIDHHTTTDLDREIESWLPTSSPSYADSPSSDWPLPPTSTLSPSEPSDSSSTPSGDTGNDDADTDGIDPDTRAAVLEHLPTLDWQELFAREDTGEDWIIEPLLAAGRATALYSAPKVGKSLLALEAMVEISRGGKFAGQQLGRPRGVLYVDHENDPVGDIRSRLLNMGYGPEDVSNVHYLSFPVMSPLDAETGGRQLLAAAQVYGCEVVVLDTVSRTIGGDENENDTWLAFYRSTGIELKRARIALLRLDHSGKDEARGQRGASAKSGDVDAVWRMSTRVEDEVYELVCEANRMPIAEKTLSLRRLRIPRLHHAIDGLGGLGTWLSVNEAASQWLTDGNYWWSPLGYRKLQPMLHSAGVKIGERALMKLISEYRERNPEPADYQGGDGE